MHAKKEKKILNRIDDYLNIIEINLNEKLFKQEELIKQSHVNNGTFNSGMLIRDLIENLDKELKDISIESVSMIKNIQNEIKIKFEDRLLERISGKLVRKFSCIYQDQFLKIRKHEEDLINVISITGDYAFNVRLKTINMRLTNEINAIKIINSVKGVDPSLKVSILAIIIAGISLIYNIVIGIVKVIIE